MRKLPAVGMLVSLFLIVLTIIFDASISVELSSSMMTLGGLGIWVFGIWSSILLLKD